MEGPTLFFLAGLALTCGVLLFRTHWQIARQTNGDVASQIPIRAASKQAPELDRETAHAHLERHPVQSGRDLDGQLDAKIALLRQLIEDARRQAERLEAALAQAAPPGRPASAKGGARLVERLRAGANQTTVKQVSPATRRHSEIYSLADTGLSNDAIASRLGSPIGEVELILGLRQRNAA